MTHLVELSDAAYERLAAEAQRRGLHSIEELIETWPIDASDDHERHHIVREIRAFRNQLTQKYGLLHDSAESIREDRER